MNWLLSLPGLRWLDRELLRPAGVVIEPGGNWGIKPEGRFSRFRRRRFLPAEQAQAELLRRRRSDATVLRFRDPD